MPSPEVIARIIRSVQEGKYSKEELTSLRDNATKHNNDEVLREIEIRMRKDFPSHATKLFGKKEDYATNLLQTFYAELETQYDLSKNCVGSHVKAGGEMKNGNKHIDVYISYKNSEEFGIALALIQETAESELMVKLERYKTGDDKFRDIRMFTMGEFGEAKAEYRAKLEKLL